jgi:hypothetical protein
MDLVPLATGAPQTPFPAHRHMDTVRIDVADIPRRQRGLMAQARLLGTGPQHRQRPQVVRSLRNLRDAVDTVRRPLDAVPGGQLDQFHTRYA